MKITREPDCDARIVIFKNNKRIYYLGLKLVTKEEYEAYLNKIRFEQKVKDIINDNDN